MSTVIAPIPPNDDTEPSPPRPGGVAIEEVELGRDEADTDIDIIAIHGLNTTSHDTWAWKDQKDPKNERKWVNWLHPGMLPDTVKSARIFTCDWPADLLVPSDRVPKMIDEYALLLLDGIERKLFAGRARQDRPICFIASCLGGIILIEALVHANEKTSEYFPIRDATRGIVFLATPFRGTAFQDVASWAEKGLKLKATVQRRVVSRLFDSVKGPTFELQRCVGNFTRLCQDKDHPCEPFSFYELGTTRIPFGKLPRLLSWLGKRKQLVDKSSATLDIVQEPLFLERSHSLMNKFSGPECADYQKVVLKIRSMVEMIRTGTLLVQADRLIHDKHYTEDRLNIQRLSGKVLDMSQCYINLAIVQTAGAPLDGWETPSRQSLSELAGTPNDAHQVELSSIFDARRRMNGQLKQTKRILIRGRAGVGKTTLCKKIVHDFYDKSSELRGVWGKLFDRILWLPLRKLKQEHASACNNLEDLFYLEYFSSEGQKTGSNLAERLRQALDGKTVFILDGFDEVSGVISEDNSRSKLLLQLLNQPAVIITSRPLRTIPDTVKKFDLELETVGFYPEQVKSYIATTIREKAKITKMEVFLEERPAIQGLTRIPIQLDAICYTWEDLDHDKIMDNMTKLYSEVELQLWKKDALRLEKIYDGVPLQEDDIKEGTWLLESDLIKREVLFLECLAFTGLQNNTVDFTSNNLNTVLTRFEITNFSPQKALPLLSFLRASDTSSAQQNRSYHFIHLTFQEYFAARCFVRQWEARDGELRIFSLAGKETETRVKPIDLLRQHKYTPHYDIFWRFVAGLLNERGLALGFMEAIEEEPLDLIGRIHQLLVMHCLFELPADFPRREFLEKRLSKWLVSYHPSAPFAETAEEAEAPEGALVLALRNELDQPKKQILSSLTSRVVIPDTIAKLVKKWIYAEDIQLRHGAIGLLVRQASLPGPTRRAILEQLEHGSLDVRRMIVEQLEFARFPSDDMLMLLVKRLEDEDSSVRKEAVITLCTMKPRPDSILPIVAKRLHDEDRDVRISTANSLCDMEHLPYDILEAIAEQLQDKPSDVQIDAAFALFRRKSLPDSVLSVLAEQLKDGDVREATTEKFSTQDFLLPDCLVEALMWRFRDRHQDQRIRIAEHLCRQESLSSHVIDAIAANLDDANGEVRASTVAALCKQASLADRVFDAIVARLHDGEMKVRACTVRHLCERVSLPESALAAMLARLDDEVNSIQVDVVKYLLKRAALPDDVLIQLILRLSDTITTYTLDWRAALHSNGIAAIAARLDHESPRIRHAAIKVLGSQVALPEDILAALTEELEDGGDSDINSSDVMALVLANKAPPSQNMHAAIERQLNDVDAKKRETAIDILGLSRLLPHVILRLVAAVISSDERQLDWQAALRIFLYQLQLPDDMFETVLAKVDRMSIGLQYLVTQIFFLQRDNFRRNFLTEPLVKALYSVFARNVSPIRFSFYIHGDKFYINGAGDLREFRLDGRGDDVRKWINEARHETDPLKYS